MTAVMVASLGSILGAGCDSRSTGTGEPDGRADVDRRDGVQNGDTTVDGPAGDTTVDAPMRDAGDGGLADTVVDSSDDGIQDGRSEGVSGDGDAGVDGPAADSTRDGVLADTTRDGTQTDSTRDGGLGDTTRDGAQADSTRDGGLGDSTRDGAQTDTTADGAVSTSGCSDGDREAFSNTTTHPDIAGCAGGWSVPGVLTVKSPSCNRQSGNSSGNPTGNGCAAEDLCAAGWHICAGPTEVAAKSTTGCTGAVGGGRTLFFTTRQSGPGNANCSATGANDIFGCGTLGAAPASNCAPLDRFSQNLCSSLGAPWSCGSDGVQEANNVIKTAAAGGGVLCCR